MTGRSDRLWIGICCAELPLLAIWHRLPRERPVAVHGQHRGQTRIVQANHAASRAGVRAGQRLAAALAILPGLHSQARNHPAERRLLEQMALVAYAHSDQVRLIEPDSLLLEVGGSRRLRGSIHDLARMLRTEFEQQRLPVRLGLAPTPAAARLLARTGRFAPDPSTLETELRRLPLSILDVPEATQAMLEGCGLRLLGDLLGLPRAERTRRFGIRLNQTIDELLGRRRTPLAGWRPAEVFHLVLELPAAAIDSRALRFPIHRGLDHLAVWLKVRDQRLTQLSIGLKDEQAGPAARFRIGLSRPGFDRARLQQLVALKLERLRLPAAIASLELRAETTGTGQAPQTDLFTPIDGNDQWSALLDRLTARLGQDAVCGLVCRADHRPERAWDWTRPGSQTPSITPPPRPGWLLPDPRPCRAETLVLEDGPERIETGWWDGRDCRRDYWTASDRQGRRLWVFREYKPRDGWFIHGVFG